MKLIFLGTSITSDRSGHRGRVLRSLIPGVADRGHHVVFFESEADAAAGAHSSYCKIVRYADWTAAKRMLEAEAETASAVVVTSGFAEGAPAIDWLFELPVPARIYYSLDPWEELRAFDAEGAAPWVRADQIENFDLVFSLAGGPALEAFESRWHAREVAPLYETIDTASFYPRKPVGDLSSDCALVADRDAPVEGVVESLLLEAARALPDHRFLVVGAGWERAGAWPDNVERRGPAAADERAAIYSSARLVLVPTPAGAIDHALPLELLEPVACGSTCAVVDRPGITDFFERDREILIPESSADLVRYLASVEEETLLAVANLAEKRMISRYAKLPRSVQFEQRVAKKYFGA